MSNDLLQKIIESFSAEELDSMKADAKQRLALIRGELDKVFNDRFTTIDQRLKAVELLIWAVKK